jgi:hypothetical protein
MDPTLLTALAFVVLASVDSLLWRRWAHAPRGARSEHLVAAVGMLGAALVTALDLVVVARR